MKKLILCFLIVYSIFVTMLLKKAIHNIKMRANNSIQNIKVIERLNRVIYRVSSHSVPASDRIKEKLPYIPSESRIKIKDNKIEIKEYGMCFRPGLQLNLFPYELGVDAKIAYRDRIGLNLGLFLSGPTLTMSYKLDKIKLIQNTEIFMGIKFRHLGNMSVAGVRINI